MSYTIVKNSNGDPFIVSNIVKNSAGASFVVSDDVKDSDGNLFTVFGATVDVTPVPSVTFVAIPNRKFIA